VPLTLRTAPDRADRGVDPLVLDFLGDDILFLGPETLVTGGVSTLHTSFSLLLLVFAAPLHIVVLYCSSEIVFDTSSSKLRTATKLYKLSKSHNEHAEMISY